MEKASDIPGLKKIFDRIFKQLPGGKNIYISPLPGATKSFFAGRLIKKDNYKQIVVLLPDVQSVMEMNVELSLLGYSEHLLTVSEFKSELMQEKLTEISRRNKFILLSTYSLLNCLLPAPDKIQKNTTNIQVGGELTYDDLIEYLNLLTYTRDKFVEVPGDYSVRGSIIDFWSYSEQNPVRVEFDGDFIESIRFFDPESQRSIQPIDRVSLAGSLTNNGNNTENFSDIFSYLESPVVLASEFELQHLKPEKINCFAESIHAKAEDKPEEEETENKAMQDTSLLDEFPEPAFIPGEIENDSGTNGLYYSIDNENVSWIIEEEINTEGRIDAGFTEAPSVNGNYEVLYNLLNDYASQKFEIILTSENELQSARLKDLLSNYKSGFAELIESGKVQIETLAIKKGFIHRGEKILLLTDYQVFNKPYRTRISTAKKYKKTKSKAFASIKRGDFVVHEDYGIGKYAGLETIKIGETDQESMKIIFNEGGIVYVNLNYLSLVKKYSSGEQDGGLAPVLSTLGTADWANTKKKAKKRIKEAARELIELYARRKATEGYSFSSDTIWQKELEASFFYEDTPDQAKVTEEVKEDMEALNPMDRLVCGDVGFGKTEIAVRAAFKAVQDGKQAAVLVPTTILAEQHFNTFKDRLSQFPVRIAALSRFQSKKQQAEIVDQLAIGNVDILVGTHRLLSKDVKFKDLGLLVIDEEHRFGVMAKEKLRAIKANVDTLTLTATPIPRTLNLSLLGARDLSIIATPPPNRQPIYTTVAVFDVLRIKEWIMNELRRGGQVYFVHDRVMSIEKLAAYMHRYIPDIKVAIAHGQMKPTQLEEIIHGFLNKKYDVLLSTKIIESGIDIPNANTIIVNRADRFGLSELHQLRGRVGRSDRQAYAYFIVPSLNGITKKALRRLQAIEEFNDIGAGFNLSMRDLEIRGAGNLLGMEQSGFINDVGFDLYIKLINEAVEELKYQEFKEVFKNLPKAEERTEPTIDSFFEIGIPKEYMPEQMDRLSYYTMLYSIKNLNEIEELKEEIKDKYGPLPVLVKRLIASAVLKHYASLALFERIIIQRKSIFIILPRGEKEDYYKIRFIELMRFIMDNFKDSVKFSQQKDVMKLVINNNFENPERILEFLIKFSREVGELFEQNPVTV
jgi:transcription-repair coupling factor (superfamily II helicase)